MKGQYHKNKRYYLDLTKYVEKQEQEPLTYSVNLMWINNTLSDNQQHIWPDQMTDGYLKSVMGWLSKSNPDTMVYLWYDKTHTNDNAIENTEKLIQNEMKNLQEPHTIITFRNVRDIDLVKDNPDVFSDKIPVYFRADLLRVIIGHELTQDEKKSYVVYSDLNVPPLSKEELFDVDTLNKINMWGIIWSQNNVTNFENIHWENGFYILDPNNVDMMHAIKLSLIDINIERAKHVLIHGYNETLTRKIFEQILWYSISRAYTLYLFYRMKGDFNDPHFNNQHKVYVINGKYFIIKYFKEYIIAVGTIGTNYRDIPILEEVDKNEFRDTPNVYFDTAEKRREQYKVSTDLFNINGGFKYSFRMWKEQPVVTGPMVVTYNDQTYEWDTQQPSTTKTKLVLFDEVFPTKQVNKPPSSNYNKI